MGMMVLNNNSDLYSYLLALAKILERRLAHELSAEVRRAAQQATGLSTEFLGESLIALTHLSERENGILTSDE